MDDRSIKRIREKTTSMEFSVLVLYLLPIIANRLIINTNYEQNMSYNL